MRAGPPWLMAAGLRKIFFKEAWLIGQWWCHCSMWQAINKMSALWNVVAWIWKILSALQRPINAWNSHRLQLNTKGFVAAPWFHNEQLIETSSDLCEMIRERCTRRLRCRAFVVFKSTLLRNLSPSNVVQWTHALASRCTTANGL